ncbi:MAG: TonB-dependent receptor plug domain-containing protein [Acidobacteriota bacterium]
MWIRPPPNPYPSPWPSAPKPPRVDVIGATPLPGVDLLASQIPSAVQTITAEDLIKSGSVNVFDVLNQRMNSVFINEINGNPFQPDVNYRGFTASPLLGTPQGISVYMDGVRMNQPFGDVISWDLIPRVAVAEMALIPGSDPLFGLNTLGGALSIRTKDGTTNPGSRLQIAGGSYGRRMADLEHGGSKGRLDWYGATSFFFDNGWRDASPSNVRQFMGKLGWHGAKTMLGVTAMYANNQLNGGVCRSRLCSRATTAASTPSPTSAAIARRYSISRAAARSVTASPSRATPTIATSARAPSTPTSTKIRSINPSISPVRRNALR